MKRRIQIVQDRLQRDQKSRIKHVIAAAPLIRMNDTPFDLLRERRLSGADPRDPTRYDGLFSSTSSGVEARNVHQVVTRGSIWQFSRIHLIDSFARSEGLFWRDAQIVPGATKKYFSSRVWLQIFSPEKRTRWSMPDVHKATVTALQKYDGRVRNCYRRIVPPTGGQIFDTIRDESGGSVFPFQLTLSTRAGVDYG